MRSKAISDAFGEIPCLKTEGKWAANKAQMIEFELAKEKIFKAFGNLRDNDVEYNGPYGSTTFGDALEKEPAFTRLRNAHRKAYPEEYTPSQRKPKSL